MSELKPAMNLRTISLKLDVVGPEALQSAIDQADIERRLHRRFTDAGCTVVQNGEKSDAVLAVYVCMRTITENRRGCPIDVAFVIQLNLLTEVLFQGTPIMAPIACGLGFNDCEAVQLCRRVHEKVDQVLDNVVPAVKCV